MCFFYLNDIMAKIQMKKSEFLEQETQMGAAIVAN